MLLRAIIEFLIEKREKKTNNWTDMLCAGRNNYFLPPLEHKKFKSALFSRSLRYGAALKAYGEGFVIRGRCDIYYFLISCGLFKSPLSFALPSATFHLGADVPVRSFRLLSHILSFICLCCLKKENASEMNGRACRKPNAAARCTSDSLLP